MSNILEEAKNKLFSIKESQKKIEVMGLLENIRLTKKRVGELEADLIVLLEEPVENFSVTFHDTYGNRLI